MKVNKTEKYSWCCGIIAEKKQENEFYTCKNCDKECDVREFWETRETQRLDLILEKLDKIIEIIR